jgi:hypothetical protein
VSWRSARRLVLSAITLFVFTLTLVSAQGASAQSNGCDPIDPAACMLPFPNDYFTAPDSSTPTGRRINFQLNAMPANAAGKPIDPTDYNRADGYSPGQLIVTHVPGLDNQTAFQKTGAVPITDINRTYDRGQPIVLLNADTLRRQLIWSELDSTVSNPSAVNLLIRPAVNLSYGGHYIVALRNLKNADDKTIKASDAFRIYRDRLNTTDPDVEARRPHMEQLFRTLANAGIARKSLFIAWDFTVGSLQNISERLLYMRNDAFSQLGDGNLADLQVQGSSPNFVVTSTTDFAPCGTDGCQSGEDDRVARRVQGRIIVPCYLDRPGCPPGSQFAFTPGSNLPTRITGNTMPANFECDIPRSAVDGPKIIPARPSLYGHGLFGTASEVEAGNVKAMGNEHNFVFCATDWVGMAEEDIPNAVAITQDLSNFPSLADRLQQAMINFLYLGRAMIHPDGFNSNPAFHFDKGSGPQGVIDTTRLFYDGNSQGGIAGGLLTTVAPDFDRAVLGVPGMNYSTLLTRSVDFDDFAALLYPAYPKEIERQLWMSMIEMLWQRGEPVGYAARMTSNPLPDTPPHTVLIHEAFGDHQVANVATEVEARTIGARLRQPALDPGRHTDVNPFYGIPAITSFPYPGSAIVVWDSGVPPPPTTNTPPRAGRDPHGDPRSTFAARAQKSEFLKVGGQVIDTCNAAPCHTDAYTPPTP